MENLSKHDTKHLAELSRLKLTARELTKLEGDLENILGHFEELKNVPTDGVEPMAGGTALINEARKDEPERTEDTGKGKDQFPDSDGRHLKVPGVFS